MNAIETLYQFIVSALPEAQTEIIQPRDPAGRWTLDVSLDDWLAVIFWNPAQGFAYAAGPLEAESAYGEGLDRPYPGHDPERLAELIISHLRERKTTHPPRAVLLQELRTMLGLTQVELAERLGVGQGTVSKTERRQRMAVSTLVRMVAAMGGELEFWVRFPDDAPVRLMQFTPPAGEPSTSPR